MPPRTRTAPRVAQAPERAQPACGQCGWTGEANADQSPYIACTRNGECDPTRHHRTPIGVTTP